MKISTVLDHVDTGHMALPEFQRGYVWNREQVRDLFQSLYNRFPVGGLLVWVTQTDTAAHRGNGPVAPGVVNLILDGQQRITSLYGVIRGKPPEFFDGDTRAFSNLCFHLEDELFAFHQPIKMRDDPYWVDVSEIFSDKVDVDDLVDPIDVDPKKKLAYMKRMHWLESILHIDLHVEEITGDHLTVDTIVDIFNRVNSGGTKLSKGDLALAKICADWPAARDTLKGHLRTWERAGYGFNHDWLLRNVNTVLTGEAKFQFLTRRSAHDIQDGLDRTVGHVDKILNLIANRLGLDHEQVLFGKFAIPVLARYLEASGGHLDATTRDKLLFWFIQVGMWGRYSGSTETRIDEDLEALQREGDPLDNLLEHLRLNQGTFRVEAGHFDRSTRGARFYSVLYLLTRMCEARDWGTGLPIKRGMLGNMSRLEVHHIFPKDVLKKAGVDHAQRNAVANFALLTKDTNLSIGARPPTVYFYDIEEKHPGALASQWIPMDSALWEVERYPEFLAARRELLAQATNEILLELLHDDTGWMEADARRPWGQFVVTPEPEASVVDDDLDSLHAWLKKHGLPGGILGYEHDDTYAGMPIDFDVAWPDGLQEGLSERVALLLDSDPDKLALASETDFRVFTNRARFKAYVEREVVPLLATGEVEEVA